ncbi:MAG: hypothetical protein IT437_08425 [Phycisphaerales bacterium]|nr:hypothetical protein [Phycisphaerales bacterium]
MRVLAVLAVAGAALASPASADIVIFKFSGTITEVQGPAPVPVGTPFTFEYKFDSFTPDSDPAPNHGIYADAISQATVELDGNPQFASGPGEITVLNNGFAGDTYSGYVPNGLGYAQVNLGDLQGQVFSDDKLPAAIALGAFELRAFYLHQEIGPTFWEIRGQVDDLVISSGECYPDCNGDSVLNLSDFGCFTTRFALGDPYADCNGDSALNLSDFGCFTTKFALGCP